MLAPSATWVIPGRRRPDAPRIERSRGVGHMGRCCWRLGARLVVGILRVVGRWRERSDGPAGRSAVVDVRANVAAIVIPQPSPESIALESDIDIKLVNDQLGHSSIRITLDTYQHVLRDLHDKAAAHAAAMVDGA
jgi:hypothetical protein